MPSNPKELEVVQQNRLGRWMRAQLDLDPYVLRIQDGKVPLEHLAILYIILQYTSESHSHQLRGAVDNVTYVHRDGHSEAVYDKNKQEVKDGYNDASYNYFHAFRKPLLHFTYDTAPWLMLGRTRKDPTSVRERVGGFLWDLKGGLRRTHDHMEKVSKISTSHWAREGQVIALAIWMKVIDNGNAQSLFSLYYSGSRFSLEETDKVLERLQAGLEATFSKKPAGLP